MQAGDLAAVGRIAGAVHPGLPEDAEVFAERLMLHPGGCRMLMQHSGPAGYVVSHPWHFGACPALNTLIGTIPADSDTYYIHDLALLPQARGTGAGAAIVAALKVHARAFGMKTLSLVAIGASAPFWGRQGFAEVSHPAATAKLASYGDTARFMACTIA